MISSTMIASSTTIPVGSESPSSVNVLRVNPKKFRNINDPISNTGMAMITLTAELIELRKSQQTIEVSRTA